MRICAVLSGEIRSYLVKVLLLPNLGNATHCLEFSNSYRIVVNHFKLLLCRTFLLQFFTELVHLDTKFKRGLVRSSFRQSACSFFGESLLKKQCVEFLANLRCSLIYLSECTSGHSTTKQCHRHESKPHCCTVAVFMHLFQRILVIDETHRVADVLLHDFGRETVESSLLQIITECSVSKSLRPFSELDILDTISEYLGRNTLAPFHSESEDILNHSTRKL